MARLIVALGLNPAHQAALFRLRGRLTWRQYAREPGRIVGALLAALIFLPLVLLSAAGSFLGYTRLPAPWPGQLLGGVLTLVWGIWLVAPLVLFSLNEGLDLTRLLVFPVGRRDLAVSFVLGTLFDFPTYFMLPLFAAIVLAFGLSPGLPLVLLALLVAYGQVVFSSQLVITVAGGVLRSRRFRDISLILLSLLGTSCWLLQSAVRGLTERLDIDRATALAWRPLETLQWLPPGAAARAIERVGAGAWGESLLWLAYAAAWLLLFGWAWVRLLGRWLTGEGFLVGERVRAPAARQRRSAPSRRAASLPGLPADITALLDKELRSMWRVPQRRVGLIQIVLMPLLLAGLFLFGGEGEALNNRWALLSLAAFSYFLFYAASQNMLGFEGPGLTQLLATPVPRWRLFAGKGLAILMVHGLVLLVLATLLGIVARNALAAAALAACLGQGAAQIGAGSVGSVLFPMPVNLEQTGRRGRTTGGCAAGLANALLLPTVQGLIGLPALAPLALGLVLNRPWIAWLGIPLAPLYGGSVFALGLSWAGRLLLRREPEVIAATRLPDEGA